MFIKFNKQVYGSSLLRIVPGCHLELCKGSDAQNIHYIQKGNDWHEIGDCPLSVSKDRDKKNFYKTLIDDCKILSENEFIDKYPAVYFNSFQKVLDVRTRANADKCIFDGDLRKKNLWIFGSPGCGKTSFVHREFNPEEIYEKNINKWWNGVDPAVHRCILIDDFPSDGQFLSQFVKIWGDRFPFNGEMKGAHIWLNPANFFIIVTSNYRICECFKETDAAAIKRRFNEIDFINPLEKLITIDKNIRVKTKFEIALEKANEINDIEENNPEDINDGLEVEGENIVSKPIISSEKVIPSDEDEEEDDDDSIIE